MPQDAAPGTSAPGVGLGSCKSWPSLGQWAGDRQSLGEEEEASGPSWGRRPGKHPQGLLLSYGSKARSPVFWDRSDLLGAASPWSRKLGPSPRRQLLLGQTCEHGGDSGQVAEQGAF